MSSLKDFNSSVKAKCLFSLSKLSKISSIFSKFLVYLYTISNNFVNAKMFSFFLFGSFKELEFFIKNNAFFLSFPIKDIILSNFSILSSLMIEITVPKSFISFIFVYNFIIYLSISFLKISSKLEFLKEAFHSFSFSSKLILSKKLKSLRFI